MSEHDQEIREIFKKEAAREGKSLRQWCRDNGIVYDTLVGREIPSDTPLSAVHDHNGSIFGSCPVCENE